MNNTQRLQQSLQQRLSPQQIMYVRLLELPVVEMEDRIKQELVDNPALEEGVDMHDREETNDSEYGDEASEYAENDERDMSLDDYRTEDDIPEYKLAELREREDRREEIPFTSGVSLQDYLFDQLALRNLSERERKIGEYIIGNIDDNGYLRRDLVSITDDLIFKAGIDVDKDEIRAVLDVIQDFEPAGIGARDLRECLMLQLKKKQPTVYTQQAIAIVTYYFDAFAKKHYDFIRRNLDVDDDGLRNILREITSLNPKPGGNYNTVNTASMQVVPDFIVETNNDELTLILNHYGIPSLHVSREYVQMFDDYSASKANQTSEMRATIQFVKQKLEAAQWFIDSIRQRQETLRRTMQAIIDMQREFFLTGDETRLKPMILKDVAQRSGYDISTVSRVSNSKYVQTNYGILPLKFFFSESAQNESGEEISTRGIKLMMKQLIDAEDKHNPLTDDILSDALKEKGYRVARRTVAKYREQMDIPIARLRKEL